MVVVQPDALKQCWMRCEVGLIVGSHVGRFVSGSDVVGVKEGKVRGARKVGYKRTELIVVLH